MKKIFLIISIFVLSFSLCGCVSKAEFDALESRVEVLEQKHGISSATKVSESSDATSEINSSDFYSVELKNYIKNYDEVVTLLQQEFHGDLIIKDVGPYQGEEGTLKQFGNGNYVISINDVLITIGCKDFIGETIFYSNGADYVNIDVQTGQKF